MHRPAITCHIQRLHDAMLDRGRETAHREVDRLIDMVERVHTAAPRVTLPAALMLEG